MENTRIEKGRLKYKLAILENSIEKQDANEAIKEWELVDYKELPTKCICGQNISHVFYIKNVNNNIVLKNGSDCICKTDHKYLIKQVSDFIDIKSRVDKIVSDDDLSVRFNKMLDKMTKEHEYQLEKIFSEAENKLSYFIKQTKTLTIKYGKYKGKTYDKIDKGYIRWYKEKSDKKDYMLNNLCKLIYGVDVIQINDGYIEE